jgi:hypothetical protein
MRKLAIFAAAFPLLITPGALAADRTPQRQSVCRVPDTDIRYDTDTFTFLVVVPISGCVSRQDRTFVLSASISRLDDEGGRDVTERSATCGPYPADDAGHDDDTTPPTCDLAVLLDHPRREDGVRYDVEVTFPGAAAERTMRQFTFCTSDAETASCEQ